MEASTLGNGALARLTRAEKDIEKLDIEKAERGEVTRLADEVASLRRAVVGFAVTIGASAIVFAFGIVAVLG